MYKDSKRTCTTIVLLIKPFVWRRSRCRRRRVLLKLPIKHTTTRFCASQTASSERVVQGYARDA